MPDALMPLWVPAAVCTLTDSVIHVGTHLPLLLHRCSGHQRRHPARGGHVVQQGADLVKEAARLMSWAQP